MTKEQLLITKLMEYGASDVYPLHMPGHKRQLSSHFQGDFPNPFSIDITEIAGFDNLHHPEGILKESMAWASQVYGAEQTYYLVNGSSCGVLAAICGTTHPGGKILMSRNCHKSAYHGVVLNHLDVTYIYPQIISDLGIQGGILPSDVEKALSEDAEIEAVLIVSPTYDGIVSDIEAIATITHKYKIPLIVDEAHGAHFPFGRGKEFPISALELGADLVIQSLHKTLPSFTQTAVLHRKGTLVKKEKLESNLQMFQTSSPSYVLMAGMEQCIYEMSEHGEEAMEQFGKRLNRLRTELGTLKRLRLVGCEQIEKNGVFAVDRSKIVISCKSCMVRGKTLDGEYLGDWLRERYHLEMELCGADYVVAITTFLDSEEGLNRFVHALLEIDSQLKKMDAVSDSQDMNDENGEARACMLQGSMKQKDRTQEDQWKQDWLQEQALEQKMRLADALEAEYECCRLEDSVGRISGEFVYLYPPGIPMITPGEVVSETIIKKILEYKKMCLPIQGMADKNIERLRVLKWEKSFT